MLFLDEPTTGLDPTGRAGLWDVVEELTATGTTVVLTTQYLEEADRLADDIVVLDHGRVAARGTPAQLKGLVGGKVVTATIDHSALDRLPRRPDGERPAPPGQVTVSFNADDAAAAEASSPTSPPPASISATSTSPRPASTTCSPTSPRPEHDHDHSHDHRRHATACRPVSSSARWWPATCARRPACRSCSCSR